MSVFQSGVTVYIHAIDMFVSMNVGYVPLTYNYHSDLGTVVELQFITQNKCANSIGRPNTLGCCPYFSHSYYLGAPVIS